MEELLNEQAAQSTKEDERIKGEMADFKKSFEVTKKGILSIQGRTFKEDCRKLLDPNHIISLNEFETITMDHNVYNSLGGNHEGDGLYDLVQTKYNNGLHNQPILPQQ